MGVWESHTQRFQEGWHTHTQARVNRTLKQTQYNKSIEYALLVYTESTVAHAHAQTCQRQQEPQVPTHKRAQKQSDDHMMR